MGFALRLRWEWLRRTDDSRTWRELPSTTERLAAAMFQASVKMVVGDGARTRFWTDCWLQGSSIQLRAPNLVAAVPPRCRLRSVKVALDNRRWVRDIRGALTVQVILESGAEGGGADRGLAPMISKLTLQI